MAKVIIAIELREEIFRKFKSESVKLFSKFKQLEKNPKRGKAVGHVGDIVIKELKYGKFRFYFITDGFVLKFGSRDQLAALLLKFIRMSEKKDQKKMILKIKEALLAFGFDGL